MPGKSHGRRSLGGCSPWGRYESDTTEQLHFHFSLSCIGEGNGNPLQCSCLENSRDGGTWWAALYGVAQSRTRLKQLSSSSSSKSSVNVHLFPTSFFTPLFSSFSKYGGGGYGKKKVNHNYGSSLTSLKIINIIFFQNLCTIYPKYIQNFPRSKWKHFAKCFTSLLENFLCFSKVPWV